MTTQTGCTHHNNNDPFTPLVTRNQVWSKGGLDISQLLIKGATDAICFFADYVKSRAVVQHVRENFPPIPAPTTPLISDTESAFTLILKVQGFDKRSIILSIYHNTGNLKT